MAKNIHFNEKILSIKQVICCIAKSKFKINSFTKYGPFQFTAVCSHAQSAGPPFIAAEATSVR